MPLTPTHDLPYPDLAENANVPEDVQALALAVAAELDLQVPLAMVGVALGVAELGADGLVPPAQLPAMSGAGYGIALPGSPTDGQEHILVDSLTAPTYQWRFRYNAGSLSAYKWEYIGGAPAFPAEILTDESSTSTGAWVDLASVGPAFTLPRAGDYAIAFGADFATDPLAGAPALTGVKLGAAAMSANDAVRHSYDNKVHAASRTMRRNGLAAAAVVKLMYYSPGYTSHWAYRWLNVTPIRVA